MAGGPPMWRGTYVRAEAWRSVLGASEYLVRAVKYGILDLPVIPFTEGLIMGEIPQMGEDEAFGLRDLETGCR